MTESLAEILAIATSSMALLALSFAVSRILVVFADKELISSTECRVVVVALASFAGADVGYTTATCDATQEIVRMLPWAASAAVFWLVLLGLVGILWGARKVVNRHIAFLSTVGSFSTCAAALYLFR